MKKHLTYDKWKRNIYIYIYIYIYTTTLYSMYLFRVKIVILFDKDVMYQFSVQLPFMHYSH